jgi:hypothetical protein
VWRYSHAASFCLHSPRNELTTVAGGSGSRWNFSGQLPPIEFSAVLAYKPPHMHSLEIQLRINRYEVPSSESYNFNSASHINQVIM